MTGQLALDDVIGQAREGWRLGRNLCRTCNRYHQVWGVMRAAGVVGALGADAAVLPRILPDLVRPGARVLIAGAADAGQLQALSAWTRARPLSVTIADRCPAPLAVIGRLAIPAEIAVETLEIDLTRLETAAAYDLIISHSMLPFLPSPTRLELLARLKSALATGGRLVVVVRVVPKMSDADRAAHDAVWIDDARSKVLAAPEVAAITDPEDLEACLTAHAAARRQRMDSFQTAAEVEALLVQAGFKVEDTLGSGQAAGLTLHGRAFSKQSYIFVAKAA